MKEKFEKIVNIRPPFDKRDADPNKNYGIDGMNIWFILKGKKGAVQVMLHFQVYLDKTKEEYKYADEQFVKVKESCINAGFNFRESSISERQVLQYYGTCYVIKDNIEIDLCHTEANTWRQCT